MVDVHTCTLEKRNRNSDLVHSSTRIIVRVLGRLVAKKQSSDYTYHRHNLNLVGGLFLFAETWVECVAFGSFCVHLKQHGSMDRYLVGTVGL